MAELTDLERYRAATVRPWIRGACKLAIGMGLFAIPFTFVGLLFKDAVSVEWSFGGDYGWSYEGPVGHPLALLTILEVVLWALAGFAILRGKSWALGLTFAMLGFQTLDWFAAFVLELVGTYPHRSYQIAFVLPLLVMAVASGQWREWRSPKYFESSLEQPNRDQSDQLESVETETSSLGEPE